MSVSGIEGVGFTPYVAPTVSPTGPTGSAAVSSADGQRFGDMVLSGIDHLEGVQDRADQLSVQAATGDLSAIHDYTIAATEASVTTQLTVAMRNKAVEAFTEIMRMQA
jgi:flagellar hook-basal body complex protein FliE